MSALSKTSLADTINSQRSVPLGYSVSSVSSFSGSYEPGNILYDRPTELSSRWSGASITATLSTSSSTQPANAVAGSSSTSRADVPVQGNAVHPQGPTNGKQYLVLKLDRNALAKSILFGKYHKPHPCNLRDFKVYGGPSPDPGSGLWMKLLRAGLRNDSVPEEFALKWLDEDGMVSQCSYILTPVLCLIML